MASWMIKGSPPDPARKGSDRSLDLPNEPELRDPESPKKISTYLTKSIKNIPISQIYPNGLTNRLA
jgi:hypothetical protein